MNNEFECPERAQMTSFRELAALPIYSVVLDADEIAYQHYGTSEPGGDGVQWSADGGWFATEAITLPATVLYVGATAWFEAAE